MLSDIEIMITLKVSNNCLKEIKDILRMARLLTEELIFGGEGTATTT